MDPRALLPPGTIMDCFWNGTLDDGYHLGMQPEQEFLGKGSAAEGNQGLHQCWRGERQKRGERRKRRQKGVSNKLVGASPNFALAPGATMLELALMMGF